MIMLMERPKLPISGPVAPLAAEREGRQRVIDRTGNRLCRFGRTAGYRRGAQERMLGAGAPRAGRGDARRARGRFIRDIVASPRPLEFSLGTMRIGLARSLWHE